MAKVLVATYTNFPNGVLDPFRQEFVDNLVREGNDVLLFKTNDFIADCTTANYLSPGIDKKALSATLAGFDPELVFSFNHSGLYDGLVKLFDCPVGIWLVDGPAYVVDRAAFKEQADRYHVFSPVRAFEADLVDDLCFQSSRVHYLPFCSDFNNESTFKTQNISFVGTFFVGQELRRRLETAVCDRELWSRIKLLFQSYRIARDLPWPSRLERFHLKSFFNNPLDEAWILNTIAINTRTQTLAAVADLGLTIYGTANWLDVLPHSIDLAMAFDPRSVLSKQDLEGVYNSSRIVMNVSHAQARGGLPWRVFDVMASGAVLVTDDAADLRALFGDIYIPCYQTPSEARSLSQALLSDQSRCEAIVSSCNNVIAKGHRFRHRLSHIGKILDVNLLVGGKGKVAVVEQLSMSGMPATGANGKGSRLAFKELGKLGLSALPAGGDARAIDFILEIFYSDDLNFDSTRSTRVQKRLVIGERLSVDLKVHSAPEFLRFDIGDYFSHHTAPKITIAPVHTDTKPIYELDFGKDVIGKSQFLYENDEIICGFDPYCVFRNPYKSEDIVLHFESTLRSVI